MEIIGIMIAVGLLTILAVTFIPGFVNRGELPQPGPGYEDYKKKAIREQLDPAKPSDHSAEAIGDTRTSRHSNNALHNR
jgi:hypothetical protein